MQKDSKKSRIVSWITLQRKRKIKIPQIKRRTSQLKMLCIWLLWRISSMVENKNKNQKGRKADIQDTRIPLIQAQVMMMTAMKGKLSLENIKRNSWEFKIQLDRASTILMVMTLRKIWDNQLEWWILIWLLIS